jgi:alkanesulfonate monooxygenase SsuD/methylene tetrahydromethanopterin reductase-like flavin-dependent oxidoreductase (luciferase family)
MKHLKDMAREAGRDIQVWIHAYIVCRATEKEAQDYAEHYIVEKGDYEAVDNLLEIFGMQSDTLPAEVLGQFRRHFIGGHGGYPLIGTPEQIVDGMNDLIEMGIDGILVSWVDYKTECKQWIDEIMPLMEQAGQRETFQPA